MNRWVIETATGRFLYGGRYDPTPGDPSTESVVDLPGDEMPDPVAQRYDAAAVTRLRAATPGEQLAALDEQRDTEASADVAKAVIAATVLLAERRRLGRALTAPERQALVDEWKAIYRSIA